MNTPSATSATSIPQKEGGRQVSSIAYAERENYVMVHAEDPKLVEVLRQQGYMPTGDGNYIVPKRCLRLTVLPDTRNN